MRVVITARYFAQHASAMGAYLWKHVYDYYYVSNKTDPRKNFISCRPEFLTTIVKDPRYIDNILYLDELSRLERSAQSKKMSLKHWTDVKMRGNDKTSGKVEKIRTILWDDNTTTSNSDSISTIANLESRRGRSKGLASKVPVKGTRTTQNQSVHSIV